MTPPTIPTDHHRRYLWAVMILALIMRTAFLLETATRVEFNHPHKGLDTLTFHLTALDILGGNWLLRDSPYNQAPLYPYLMAFCYKIFSADVLTIRIIQSILGVGICLLIFLIARQRFSPPISFLCASFYACYDYALFMEGSLLRATLVGFFHLSLLYCFLRYQESQHVCFAVLSGWILGLNTLTRPNAILFLPLLILIMLSWKYRHPVTFSRRLKAITVLSAAFFITLSPFIGRNLFLDKPPLQFSQQGMAVLLAGNMPHALGAGWHIPPDGLALLKEADGDTRKVLHGLWTYIKKNPKAWIKVQLRKCHALINAYEFPNNLNLYLKQRFSKVLRWTPFDFYLIILLALPGVIIALGQPRRNAMWLLFLGTLFWAIIPFYILGRFRLPMVGCLCLFIGFTLERIVSFFEKDRIFHLMGLGAGMYALSYLVAPNVTPKIFANDHYNLGLVYYHHKQWDNAESQFQQALTTAPSYMRAAKVLMTLYINQHRYQDAQNIASRSLYYDPQNLSIAMLLAQSHIHQGSFSTANIILEHILKNHPSHADAFFYQGLIKWYQKRYNESRPFFQKALDSDPHHHDARERLEALKTMPK